MSHFYGTLNGSRGAATRCGTKNSGLSVVAASWTGAVEADLVERDGVNYARVSLIPWKGAGVRRLLYDGPVDSEGTQLSIRTAVMGCLADLEHYAATHGPGPDRRLAALKQALS